MRVYSWKLLIVTILFTVVSTVIEVKNIINGQMFAIIRLISWIYISFKGFRAAFTFEGYSEDKMISSINKKVIEEIFGPWKSIGPHIGFLLIILAGLSLYFLPSQNWLSIILLIVGFIYQVLVSILVRKHIREERRKYF